MRFRGCQPAFRFRFCFNLKHVHHLFNVCCPCPQASLASGVVDACLIPEVRFDTQGPHGLFAYIDKLLSEKGHCVVCVAEGAGQDLMAKHDSGRDASGNIILQASARSRCTGCGARSVCVCARVWHVHDTTIAHAIYVYLLREVCSTALLSRQLHSRRANESGSFVRTSFKYRACFQHGRRTLAWR